MCNLDRVNEQRNNEENCKECGSSITEEGNSYHHCVNCGMQIKSLAYDTGYKFPSEVKGSRRTNTISDLGSQINNDRSSFTRKLSILQNRISKRKVSYADKIIKEAEMAGVSGIVLLELADLIDAANLRNKLTHNRDGMVGLSTLSEAEDKSQYRRRVYAVAALEILNRTLHPNQVLIIAASWKVHKNDISKGIKVIKKILLSENYNFSSNNLCSADNPSVVRYNELEFHLDFFRDHLSEIIDFTSARQIIDCAIEKLSENGEPIGNSFSDNIDGEFRNRTSQRAAMESIVYSMVVLDFNFAQIQSLYAKTPVSGMKWVNSRLGAYRQTLVEGL
jgi:ribosomal protein L37AE/L43A